MIHLMRFVFVISALIWACPLIAQQWTPMQMLHVKRISGVQVSPDASASFMFV